MQNKALFAVLITKNWSYLSIYISEKKNFIKCLWTFHIHTWEHGNTFFFLEEYFIYILY